MSTETREGLRSTLKASRTLRIAAFTLVAGLIFGFLYLLSRYSYLLFHNIAEVFSIFIAWSIFIIAWNTRKIATNDYLLFLGISYLFVGVIDLVHTLAYKGMGVFPGYGANLATQLWVGSRYLESISLLIAPTFLLHRLKAAYDFAAYTLVTALVLLSIFVWDIFPACFVEGVGLTPFKKISEYVICFILLGALAFLYRQRDALDRNVLIMLSASILVTIASELCFTLYVDPYGLFNQLGHFLKIVSFYLIYRAMVVTSLKEPYDVLFRELKQSEERFRAVVENAPFGYYRVGRDGLWQYVNPIWERMHGFTFEEVVGKPFEITQPDDAVEQARELVERALAGESIAGEFVRLTGGGDVEYHTFNIQPVKRGEDVVAIEGFLTDITDLKRAESALHESEERYRVLADTLPQVVFELGASGGITYVNQVAYRMFGYSEEDMERGLNALDIIDPSDHERITGAIQKMMDGSSLGATCEHLARRKDGTVFPCIVYSVSIPDEDGAPAGIRGILTDITERKTMEAELKRINSELDVYAEVVSHDLRGPLSVIQSASTNLDELMENCADLDTAGTGRSVVDIITKSTENAEELINNLLALARAGQAPGKINETDVRELVEKVLEEKAVILEKKGVKVEVDENLGRIMAEPTHIYQIFSNLIGNAITYNDNPHPEIGITHRESKGLHHYMVRDNGPGIPPDEVEKIFKPLYRGVSGGTGIGLSIVDKLTALYGGGISAYNTGGACFEFTLGDLHVEPPS